MKIVSWNACGLRQNVQEVRHYLESEDIDIMLLNETKLTEDVNIQIKNYKFIRKDRTAHGGGVGILIKQNICFQQLKSIPDVSIEHVGIRLENNIYIFAVYNNPRNLFIDRELLALTSLGNKVLLIGDLNARHVNWKNHVSNTNGRTLHNFITNNNLVILHTEKPTHYPPNNGTPTYIDVVINKNVGNVTIPISHAALMSDHNPISIQLLDYNISKKKKKNHIIQKHKLGQVQTDSRQKHKNK